MQLPSPVRGTFQPKYPVYTESTRDILLSRLNDDKPLEGPLDKRGQVLSEFIVSIVHEDSAAEFGVPLTFNFPVLVDNYDVLIGTAVTPGRQKQLYDAAVQAVNSEKGIAA
jgi:hypothetical protein